MSSPPNPLDEFPQPEYLPATHPVSVKRKSDENPPFNAWDVVSIVGVTIGALFVFELGVPGVAWLLIHGKIPFTKLVVTPELLVLAELLAYGVVFAFMYFVVAGKAKEFWGPIGWHWPVRWPAFLLGGSLLYFALAGVAQLLPIPKHLPIDRFFSTSQEAMLMSIFAVTFAPLMEELFFRGFLYPVLARRQGVALGIVETALAFAALHGFQLRFSWAVLIIFLVGLALTTVRAITKSVAASFFVHVGYNGCLSILLFVGTGGFRHLEKLNQ